MKAWAVAGEPRRAQASHKGAERPTAPGQVGAGWGFGGAGRAAEKKRQCDRTRYRGGQRASGFETG